MLPARSQPLGRKWDDRYARGVNGERIIDLELDKSAVKDRPPEGYIGFQDEAKRVSYRNVRIKELK